MVSNASNKWNKSTFDLAIRKTQAPFTISVSCCVCVPSSVSRLEVIGHITSLPRPLRVFISRLEVVQHANRFLAIALSRGDEAARGGVAFLRVSSLALVILGHLVVILR